MFDKKCPKCGCELVRDFLDRFIRCLGCGWYQKINKE